MQAAAGMARTIAFLGAITGGLFFRTTVIGRDVLQRTDRLVFRAMCSTIVGIGLCGKCDLLKKEQNEKEQQHSARDR